MWCLLNSHTFLNWPNVCVTVSDKRGRRREQARNGYCKELDDDHQDHIVYNILIDKCAVKSSYAHEIISNECLVVGFSPVLADVVVDCIAHKRLQFSFDLMMININWTCTYVSECVYLCVCCMIVCNIYVIFGKDLLS